MFSGAAVGQVQELDVTGGAVDQSADGRPLPWPTMRSPSSCPATWRSAASAGRWLTRAPDRRTGWRAGRRGACGGGHGARCAARRACAPGRRGVAGRSPGRWSRGPGGGPARPGRRSAGPG
ncbi:hypothetical protein FGD71_028265 [Streptomyces sporangiiformans]|uniref:Uncharacterized protein n=1 Tax=Streptomyces sporangiiformans TaxID=2315329 RepID=A0A505DEG2_9ACTN|nr:hypothetical protein FGD71_028265 [Streptomyces sporangiiformans]